MSESRLLTLTEAAEATGLSVDALRKRIKREQLWSVRGNDGLVRVRLADVELEDLKAHAPSRRPPSQANGQSSTVNALEDHLSTLREQLAKAEARADHEADERRRLLDRLMYREAELEQVRAAALDKAAIDAEERRKLVEQVAALETELQQVRAALISERARRIRWPRLPWRR